MTCKRLPIYTGFLFVVRRQSAIESLRVQDEPVPSELLAHNSPVGWEYIAFSGGFLWDRAAVMPSARRPLNPRTATRLVNA
jgi:hypothetical protein